MSMIIKGGSIAEVGTKAIEAVLQEGVYVDRAVGGWALQKSGIQKMREVHGMTIVLDNPLKRWCSNISLGTIVETEDYLLGLNPGFVHYTNWDFYDRWITEGMEKYPYTYGDRIFNDITGINQFKECMKKLQKDPTTRHASIPIWRPIDQLREYVPCNAHMHFQINEEGKLDLHTVCRSQDVLRGLFLDIFAYTILQEQMCISTGLELGKYYVYEMNIHMYQRDWQGDGWKKLVPEDPYQKGISPRSSVLLTDRDKRILFNESRNLFIEGNKCPTSEIDKLSNYWATWKKLQYSIKWGSCLLNKGCYEEMIYVYEKRTKDK